MEIFFTILILLSCNLLGALSQNLLDNYHSNYEIIEVLNKIQAKCPDITYLYDLDYKSVNGFPLRVIAISDFPDIHEIGEAEFKYIGNMHGNEVVGRELLLQLAMDLCDSYLKNDMLVMKLIKTTRIHLLITMNPDGYDISVTNEWNTIGRYKYRNVEQMLLMAGVTAPLTGRTNANDVDLNRNFPDLDKYKFEYQRNMLNKTDHFYDEINKELYEISVDCQDKPFQPETLAIINWLSSTPFVLSANFHGGSLVANYPMDDSYDHRPIYSYSEDDALFRQLAKTYSYNHATMASRNREICDSSSHSFVEGTTNGAQWYPICGGMQDFNYLGSNCFEITVEVSCEKFPAGNQLINFWNDNKKALYEYIWQVHTGIKGFVVDKFGNPIGNATIRVAYYSGNTHKRINHNVKTTTNGEYWRLLIPGIYQVWAENGDRFRSKIVNVKIIQNKARTEAMVVNFTMNAFRFRPNNRLNIIK